MPSDDFARGQTHALMSAVFALIDTHPDRTALAQRLQVDLEAGIVMALPTAASDEQLDGQQDMTDRLLRYARAAVRREAAEQADGKAARTAIAG